MAFNIKNIASTAIKAAKAKNKEVSVNPYEQQVKNQIVLQSARNESKNKKQANVINADSMKNNLSINPYENQIVSSVLSKDMKDNPDKYKGAETIINQNESQSRFSDPNTFVINPYGVKGKDGKTALESMYPELRKTGSDWVWMDSTEDYKRKNPNQIQNDFVDQNNKRDARLDKQAVHELEMMAPWVRNVSLAYGKTDEFNLDGKFNTDKHDRTAGEIDRRMYDQQGNLKPFWQWDFLPSASRVNDDVEKDWYDMQWANQRSDKNFVPSNVTKNLDPKAVDLNNIDDGINEKARIGLYMTGAQYRQYVKNGMPGRDLEDIDPDAIYSKQDESDNYGFIPYVPDERARIKYEGEAQPAFVSNVFNNFGNARKILNDYTIINPYTGAKISGHDFDKNIQPFFSDANQKILESGDFLTSSSKKENGYDYPVRMIRNNSEGRKIAEAPAGADIVNMSYDSRTGKPTIQFSDGTLWVFDNEDEAESSLDFEQVSDSRLANKWSKVPLSVTLDDGTVLTREQAAEIAINKDDYADYGFLNMGKEDVSPTDGFLPWIIDAGLQSSPYFYMPAGITKGVSDSMSNFKGIKAGNQNWSTGTYNLISENPDQVSTVTSGLGSLALPFTEMMWGPLGKQLLKMSPTRKIAEKINPSLKKGLTPERPVIKWAYGAGDEALEEMPGQIVEELQQGHLTNWYGDPVTDPVTGENMTDAQGNVIRSSDTGAIGRLKNYFTDQGLYESMLAGGILGGALGAPRVPGYIRNYNRLNYRTNSNRDIKNSDGDIIFSLPVSPDEAGQLDVTNPILSAIIDSYYDMDLKNGNYTPLKNRRV